MLTKAHDFQSAHAAARVAEDDWYLELRRRYPDEPLGELARTSADRGEEGSKLRRLWAAKIEAIKALHALQPRRA